MRWIRCEEGVSTRERIAVTSDVYGITERIKEIDKDYFVMLNRETQRFEIHISGQECTLGCEIPYDELDARTLEYVRAHHSSRIAAIQREIELAEKQAEAERRREMREIHDRAADGFAYAAKRSDDEFPDEVMEGLKHESEGALRAGGRVHRQPHELPV